MKGSRSSPPKCGKLLLIHEELLVLECVHKSINQVRKCRKSQRFSKYISYLVMGRYMYKCYLFSFDVLLYPLEVPLQVSHLRAVDRVLGPVNRGAIILQNFCRNVCDYTVGMQVI